MALFVWPSTLPQQLSFELNAQLAPIEELRIMRVILQFKKGIGKPETTAN